MMKRALKVAGIIFGILFCLIAIWWFNAAVYPFTSKNPNFKDVEAEFAKLQFPADWKEISNSENKGIAGRQCDYFDASGCFHKGKTFQLKNDSSVDDVKAFYTKSGCKSVSVTDYSYKDEVKIRYNFRCSIGYKGLYLTGSYNSEKDNASVNISTY